MSLQGQAITGLLFVDTHAVRFTRTTHTHMLCVDSCVNVANIPGQMKNILSI